jgi:hypothetical protein
VVTVPWKPLRGSGRSPFRAGAVLGLSVALVVGCGDAPKKASLGEPPPVGGACESERAAFEATLPVPAPTPGRYVVQLVNESNVTLLLGADAAHVAGQPPKSVVPRENTWVLPPKGYLTVDIPPEWEATVPQGSLGPVFWARTGCRYSIEHNLAQCETGDCGGVYDCSQKGLTPPGPKSLSEWTFRDENGNAAPDISVVDGVNLTMDVEPLGTYSPTPVGPVDAAFWLGPQNLPLAKCGQDLRATCATPFQLQRKDLTFFIAGSDGATNAVGCFSNCGQYKFQGPLTGACPSPFRCPGEPPLSCNSDPKVDPTCYYWKSFCDVAPPGDPDMIYGRTCSSDSDCPQNGACWDNGTPPARCEPRAFNLNPDCPTDVCTNQYSEKPSFQPPFGLCSDVTKATGDPSACIGEDTFHEVLPHGLTWPNDPQTYYSDAKIFRIVFAPGGTSVPVTDASSIPPCSSLPASYAYDQAKVNCATEIAKGALFAGARPPSIAPGNWDCAIADGIATNGVLCAWSTVQGPS